MFKKIFSYITNSILVGMILLGALVGYSALPLENGIKMFSVQSGSMEPAIGTGSLIFVKKQVDYFEGDVITRFTSDNNSTVTHRIVEKKSEPNGKIFFRTKGDANAVADNELFDQKKIIGKEIFLIPLIGYPISYAKTPQGLVLIIIVPAVIIIYDEFQKIKKELIKIFRKKKKSENSKEKSEFENSKENNPENETNA